MLGIKQYLLFLYLLLFIISCSDKKVTNESELNRPNIIWIMADDHSYQTLSAYDDRYIQTPNMDQIAEDGVRFTNSFVGNSLCAPSRATLQTGKHSHNNTVAKIGDTFDGRQQTFPKLLQQAGYQTALIGKWHLMSEPTGYDHYERLVGQGHYYNTDFIVDGDTTQSHGYVTNVITDKSIEWLENRDKTQPFSLQIHHKATHREWLPDTSKLSGDREEFRVFNTFPGDSPDSSQAYDVPETYFDDYEGRPAAAAQEMIVIEDMDLVSDLKMFDEEGDITSNGRERFANALYSRLDEQQRQAWDAYYDPIIKKFKENRGQMSDMQMARWKYQRYMQDYLKTVESIDDNIGRLIRYLKEHDLYENTLIVYTSDQGFYMGEHGWFDKRFMYEQSMRTPLLMKLPGDMQTHDKEQVDGLVQNIDWAPTIVDIAGLEVPEDMDGRSLLPLIQQEDPDWRDALYYHYYAFPAVHMLDRK